VSDTFADNLGFKISFCEDYMEDTSQPEWIKIMTNLIKINEEKTPRIDKTDEKTNFNS